VIVVAGGTTGLGRSATCALARAGARVVAVGLPSEPDVTTLRRELGESVLVLEGDLRDPATAKGAVAAAVELFGAFSGLYHVAGGSGRRMGDGPLHELTDEGLRATLDLNLASLVYSNRAAVRRFLSDGRGGVLLNMSSVLGFSPAPKYFATHAYAAAKAAVIGFTRSIASYYAEQNIRANVVAPALTETPMARRAASDAEIVAFARSKQPLDGGRLGQPADLDGAVVYLLSDASRFVTGQVLAVDGGWSLSEGQYGGAR